MNINDITAKMVFNQLEPKLSKIKSAIVFHLLIVGDPSMSMETRQISQEEIYILQADVRLIIDLAFAEMHESMGKRNHPFIPPDLRSMMQKNGERVKAIVMKKVEEYMKEINESGEKR